MHITVASAVTKRYFTVIFTVRAEIRHGVWATDTIEHRVADTSGFRLRMRSRLHFQLRQLQSVSTLRATVRSTVTVDDSEVPRMRLWVSIWLNEVALWHPLAQRMCP